LHDVHHAHYLEVNGYLKVFIQQAMKKSTVILISITLCFQLNIQAQQLDLGMRGGLSIPNLTAGSGNQNPLNTGYSSRLGPDAGIFAELNFTKLFSIQLMLEYSSQGGKKNGFQAVTTPDQLVAAYQAQGQQAPTYLYADYNSEAKLNYLMLPILAKFGWNLKKSRIRIYVDAGPFAALLVSAHQVTSGQSAFYADATGQQPLAGGPVSFDNNENIRGDIHRFNTGIEGNIGLNYRLGTSNLFIEGGGNYGFLNIQKNAIDGKNETGAATITLGYSYQFGR
jgi:hypothetical protein